MAIQITRELTADVTKRSSTKVIYAKQHDLNSRFLNVRIQEDGKDILVDLGSTVILNVERPDKAENMFYGSVNADGTVRIPLTSWMLELDGTLLCDISLIGEALIGSEVYDIKLTTMQFNIYVEAAVVTDPDFKDTTEYSVIVDLLTRTATLLEETEQITHDLRTIQLQSELAARAATKAAQDANQTILELYERNAEIVAEELAKRDQLKPEFLHSMEDLQSTGDITKLYVLSDGYVYAYLQKTVTINPVNQIPLSTTADRSVIFNGTGWRDTYKLNVSTGVEESNPSYAVSGFIPIKAADTFRIKNFGMAAVATSYDNICFYNSAFVLVGVFTNSSAANPLSQFMKADGTMEACIATATQTNFSAAQKSSIAYMRLSFDTFDGNTFLTVNQPLEPTVITGSNWYNTGLAFVPTDYEDRIIDLEERSTLIEDRLTALLAKDTASDVPGYIVNEAKRVADIVQSKRTVGCLTFTSMSDMHVEVDALGSNNWVNNLASCKDAGMGLTELHKLLKIDLVSMLGDYTWMPQSYTTQKVKRDLSYVKGCMTEGTKGVPSVWCTGNHDINYGMESDRRMTEDELYAYITSNNTGTVQDDHNIGRNYGYIDFENQKIRCIYLNTIDALDYPDYTDGMADNASTVSAIQAQWLVDTGLDLTSKTNPEEWGIVFFSHHCLSIFQPVTTILTAYKNGAAGSVTAPVGDSETTVNFDFRDITKGEIICAIHGHNHNFIAKKISSEFWYQVTSANAWLWSIGIPNMDTTRENEAATSNDTAWKNAFGEFGSNGVPVYYRKTLNTATSTSFCVVVIDRKNRKVHVIAYGAGIDREISY